MLPPDGHVHTEWSWDAAAGSMERSCARAVDLGLPSIAFTEHADFTGWAVDPEVKARMRPENAARVGPDGRGWVPPRPPPARLLAPPARALAGQWAQKHTLVKFTVTVLPGRSSTAWAPSPDTRAPMRYRPGASESR